MKSTADKLLTRRQIRARGWTPDMLANLLPPPDQTRENPYNVRGSPVKLYLTSTVEQVEADDAFKVRMQAAEQRKRGAAAAIETKRRKLLQAIAIAPAPELPALNQAELSRRALAMAAVAYLLAELQPYREILLTKCRGGDVAERGRAIDGKILDAIAENQPWLTDECERLKKMIRGEHGEEEILHDHRSGEIIKSEQGRGAFGN